MDKNLIFPIVLNESSFEHNESYKSEVNLKNMQMRKFFENFRKIFKEKK